MKNIYLLSCQYKITTLVNAFRLLTRDVQFILANPTYLLYIIFIYNYECCNTYPKPYCTQQDWGQLCLFGFASQKPKIGVACL